MKDTQENAERMQELSHATIEQAKDSIFWVDAESCIYRVNAAACQALGYNREELLSMRVPDFGRSLEEFNRTWGIAKEQGVSILEREMRRKDGSVYPVEIIINHIEFRGVGYAVAIVHDITERKAREEALQNAMGELEQLKSRLEAENVYLQEEIKVDHNFGDIIGRNKGFKDVLRQIEQVAPTDTTVLILGETGTGKELLARAVHDLSPRKERPLVKVNCAALPANLIESELFGHEKGAFTGAISRKVGRFELAHGGTIFLDEIGDLPLGLQAKLLRILQEGEFERVGGANTLKVDVRVIAATNRDLEEAMDSGNFREDLYYRLNVFPIHSLPLRERKDDIPALAMHFLIKYAAKIGKKIEGIPKQVMNALQTYEWPGNIRELENVMERSIILSQGNKLELADTFGRKKKGAAAAKRETLEEIERQYICEVLDSTGWQVSGEKGAALVLGLKPTTLESRMKKLCIERKKV